MLGTDYGDHSAESCASTPDLRRTDTKKNRNTRDGVLAYNTSHLATILSSILTVWVVLSCPACAHIITLGDGDENPH